MMIAAAFFNTIFLFSQHVFVQYDLAHPRPQVEGDHCVDHVRRRHMCFIGSRWIKGRRKLRTSKIWIIICLKFSHSP
jgi:hypothetical protein